MVHITRRHSCEHRLFLLSNQRVVVPLQNGNAEKKTKISAKQNPSNNFNEAYLEKQIPDKKTAAVLRNSNDLKISQERDLKTKKTYFNINNEQGKLISKLNLNEKKLNLASLNSSTEEEILINNASEISKNESTLIGQTTEIPAFSKESEFTKSNDTNNLRERVEEISTQERGFTPPKVNLNHLAIIKSLEKPIEYYQKLEVLNPAKAKTKNKKPVQNNKKFKIGIDANTYFNF